MAGVHNCTSLGVGVGVEVGVFRERGCLSMLMKGTNRVEQRSETGIAGFSRDAELLIEGKGRSSKSSSSRSKQGEARRGKMVT